MVGEWRDGQPSSSQSTRSHILDGLPGPSSGSPCSHTSTCSPHPSDCTMSLMLLNRQHFPWGIEVTRPSLPSSPVNPTTSPTTSNRAFPAPSAPSPPLHAMPSSILLLQHRARAGAERIDENSTTEGEGDGRRGEERKGWTARVLVDGVPLKRTGRTRTG